MDARYCVYLYRTSLRAWEIESHVTVSKICRLLYECSSRETFLKGGSYPVQPDALRQISVSEPISIILKVLKRWVSGVYFFINRFFVISLTARWHNHFLRDFSFLRDFLVKIRLFPDALRQISASEPISIILKVLKRWVSGIYFFFHSILCGLAHDSLTCPFFERIWFFERLFRRS